MIGRSPSFKRAFNLLKKAATSPITVLLLGETGVGKEMFARWLHDNSPRRDGPFVAVNCGAIPAELVESELFGVEAGAFTGAQKSRAGRFERADGGTLFLDEIGEMPLAAQVKLLRALQTGEIERLGGGGPKQVDVRVLAATNINLQSAVDSKQFRADLFYRLNPYPIEIPPLRDRKEDIPVFVNALIERISRRYGKVIHGVSDKSMLALVAYAWPGNIRELENVIERGVLLTAPGSYIEHDTLFLPGTSHDTGMFVDRDGHLQHGPAALAEQDLSTMENLSIADFENALIGEALKRSSGNVAEAARLLGWTRRQLDYRLKAPVISVEHIGSET